jgi:hypothetical protein
MTTIATARPTSQRAEPDHWVDDAQLAAAAFLARYSVRILDAYRHDLRASSSERPTTRSRCWRRRDPTSTCTAPGWTSAAASTIGPAALDGPRVLPIRSHRRADRVEPGPIRPPPTGPPLPSPRSGPLRAGRVSSSRRSSTTATMRRSPCCSGSTGCGSVVGHARLDQTRRYTLPSASLPVRRTLVRLWAMAGEGRRVHRRQPRTRRLAK